MGRLQGKVAVVTGAARGQGEATARLFAREGAHVAVVDLLDDGQAVADSIGASASFHRLDITDEEGWAGLRSSLMAAHGHIDVLVNNAAGILVGDILSLKKEAFEKLLNINVIGAFLGMKVLGEQMVAQGKGSIINVHSVGGLHGINGLGAYVASKWGLRGLTRTAAMEFGHRGVRVNGIFPGGIASPMAGVEEEPREVTNQRFVRQPIARIGEPEEVAYTSLFLASDEASYLAGAEIAVDGGLMSGRYEDFLPGAPAAMLAAKA
ncbi:MAG TPA: SDR family oxidoreductase [Sphingobium sp.]|nr:SDR family oxidoreductase [Sphingobium sp.]